MARAMRRRLTAICVAAPLTVTPLMVAPLALAGPAGRAILRSHGQLLHLLHSRSGVVNASQSTNWFGYNQGALDHGARLFRAIAADWTVPRATQHRRGQAESSSDWIGIGGGCVNSGCSASD